MTQLLKYCLGSHAAAANFQQWQYWLMRRTYCALEMDDSRWEETHIDVGYCLDRSTQNV